MLIRRFVVLLMIWTTAVQPDEREHREEPDEKGEFDNRSASTPVSEQRGKTHAGLPL